MDVVWRVWGSRTPRISVKGFGVPASLNPSNEHQDSLSEERPLASAVRQGRHQALQRR